MIFCAGLGTRLRPITDTIPKALLPLQGKTLLQYQIEKLRDAGIHDIVLNLHHFPDLIVRYLEEHHNFGCHIELSDESERLLDTGGGLFKAAPLLAPDPNGTEPVLACNVDILSNIDISALLAAHRKDSLATLVVSSRDTQRYLLFDEADKLCGWTHTGTGQVRPHDLDANEVARLHRLAFSGMQVISPTLFREMDTLRQSIVKEDPKKETDKFSLIDLYLSACRTHTIRAFIPSDYRMMDVGKITHLHEAEAFLQ